MQAEVKLLPCPNPDCGSIDIQVRVASPAWTEADLIMCSVCGVRCGRSIWNKLPRTFNSRVVAEEIASSLNPVFGMTMTEIAHIEAIIDKHLKGS